MANSMSRNSPPIHSDQPDPRQVLLKKISQLAWLVAWLAVTSISSAQSPSRTASKTPLPDYRGYHTRFTDGSEPNIGQRGSDPWDYARRLGVADNGSFPIPDEVRHVDMLRQSAEEAAGKSLSCIACHTDVGHMHPVDSLKLGCTDCHGGNALCKEKQQAHVQPRFPQAWPTSANPVRSYALLNHESPEFIRFVNPGDSRVAHIACGQCHAKEVLQLRTSLMTHGCMLWGAALYNNGSTGEKRPRYGESYSMHGVPQRIISVPPPTAEEIRDKGVLPFLEPMLPYQVSQPGNLLRIFERGGRFRPEAGNPERLDDAGKPRERLSNRGLGTENRTDPVFIGLQKTRLYDPTLNFLGTNDHPGDYRSSGCSSCHVLYANDRDPIASGFLAKYGNRGLAAGQKDDWVKFIDPTIPKNQSGHPIQHKFELRMPTSQCIVCHIHPGTNVLNTYLGYMWWDNETDGDLMYPKRQREPTQEEFMAITARNPEEAAVQGKWGDPKFVADVRDLNPQLKKTQFADFHSHGWIFRAVYKKDRTGQLLDWRGGPVGEVTNDKLQAAMVPPTPKEKQHGKQRDGVPVHLMDIHMERGMHCTDCHFYQDSHGNGKLYGEVRAAIEIQCIDCHGTSSESLIEKVAKQIKRGEEPNLPTSGPAAEKEGTNLLALRTAFGQSRFEIVSQPGKPARLIQRSSVEKDVTWEVTQTAHTVRPGHAKYNPRSHAAKSARLGSDAVVHWGGTKKDDLDNCAHSDEKVSCIACHSSWNPSCYGCHLPQKTNIKAAELHHTGDVTRNRTSYNFQTLRDDVFMLAHDGDVTGNRIGPVRSSCAIHVTSYNGNREAVYTQQQTISGDGLSGIAFSTNVPHTVRGGPGVGHEAGNNRSGTFETKSCTDCHLSINNDNNAIMAQLLMQGTGYTNFIGKYCYVAGGTQGISAVVVTETREPQAVIGSSLQADAFPDHYRRHRAGGDLLTEAYSHSGRDVMDTVTLSTRQSEVLDVQQRGEYLYAACGEAGLRVFDTASIDHKGFSARLTTAPVSPLGQRMVVRTKYAQAVAAPTTMAPDPTRKQDPLNHESAVHPLYGYLVVADKYEGLILVGAGTLLDGDPMNNFLERAVTYNPDGILCGSRAVSFVGTYAYVSCDAGLVVIDLDDPKHPRVAAVLGADAGIVLPRAVAAQFRYAFVAGEQGVTVLDITMPSAPVVVHHVPLSEAWNIYLARTYAYVSAGKQGLVILDITRPDAAGVDQVFDAAGCMDDVRDVQLSITNASLFAMVADGVNGLRVVQLTGPHLPNNDGYSPRPQPCLIATYPFPRGGQALAISRGVDRDRAVDESGNQLSVFGRIGARPLSAEEATRMVRTAEGRLWYTSDDIYDERVFRVK